MTAANVSSPQQQGADRHTTTGSCAPLLSVAALTVVVAAMMFALGRGTNDAWYKTKQQRRVDLDVAGSASELEFSGGGGVEPPLLSVDAALKPKPGDFETGVSVGAEDEKDILASRSNATTTPSSAGLLSDLKNRPVASLKRFFRPDCDPEQLRSVVHFDNRTRNWTWAPEGWCGIKLPLSGRDLRERLAGKRIFFLGDSVVRNSFVLTFAKLCNEDNMDKCMTRMPTYEYDLEKLGNVSGPMGCVPGATTEKSPCFQHGKFQDVVMKGLSTKSVPRDRAARRTFINKGLIGPALHMKWEDIELIYVPVTRPRQIVRTAQWMRSRFGNASRYLHADYIIVSIGPHLKMAEVQYTPLTLDDAFKALRTARGPTAPIVAAEFVHAVHAHPTWTKEVDGLMVKLRAILSQHDVALVPQRHITRRPYVLKSPVVLTADRLPPPSPELECGYYDPQHPAFRCQSVATELLVAAAIGLGQQKADSSRNAHGPPDLSEVSAPPSEAPT